MVDCVIHDLGVTGLSWFERQVLIAALERLSVPLSPEAESLLDSLREVQSDVTSAEDEEHQGDDREDDKDGPEHEREVPSG
jgi:hypothetical protein